MKIKVFALAVAAMALTVACNNKPAEVEDTLVEDKKVGRGSNEPTTSVTNNEDGTKTVKDKKVGRR